MNTEKTKSDAIDIKKTVKKTVDELNELEGDALSKTPEKIVEKTKKKKKKKKKRSKRCLTCNKKVGMFGFNCKCGDLFCGEHRYASQHNCTYDYQTEHRCSIIKNNPDANFNKIGDI